MYHEAVEAGRLTHLVGGHLADRVAGLQRLQLVQAPVKLLQCLGGQLLVGLLWGETGGKGVVSFEAFDGASRGLVPGHAALSRFHTWVTLHAAMKKELSYK